MPVEFIPDYIKETARAIAAAVTKTMRDIESHLPEEEHASEEKLQEVEDELTECILMLVDKACCDVTTVMAKQMGLTGLAQAKERLSEKLTPEQHLEVLEAARKDIVTLGLGTSEIDEEIAVTRSQISAPQ